MPAFFAKYKKIDINNADYLIPLIIGVTGHRDIPDEDIPELQKILKNEIIQIQQKYSHTPIILLTPLAEGADRIAAWAALELGIKYIAPLPMPKAEYEKDFADEKSINDFRELYNKAYKCFELPLGEGINLQNLSDESKRNHQYHKVGVYVARYSQILFALWDGVDTKKVAGTSQIVIYKREGLPEADRVKDDHFDYPDTGMVYQIVTSRKSNPAPTPDKYAVKKLEPKPRFEGDTFLNLADNLPEELERLNLEAIKHSDKVIQNINNEKTKHTNLTPDQTCLLNYYNTADTLAIIFQQKTRLALKSMLFTVVAGVFAFQLYQNIFKYYTLASIVYPLLLATAYVIYKIAERKKYQSNYLDHRAIAEGLRFQLFWDIAGINSDVTDHYLNKQKGVLNWITEAIKGCIVSTIRSKILSNENNKNPQAVIPIIKSWWIEGQLGYFKKAAPRDTKKEKNLGLTAFIIYISGLVIACSLIFRLSFPSYMDPENYLKYTCILVTLFFSISAAIYVYIEKEDFEEQIKQYERMSEVYSIALEYFDKYVDQGDHEKLKKMLFELGCEALIENSDWLAMHRARPIDIPKG